MSALKLARTNKVGEQTIQGVTYIPQKQVQTLLNISHQRLVNAVKNKSLPENAMPLEGYVNLNGSRLYPKDAIVELAMQGYGLKVSQRKHGKTKGHLNRSVNEEKRFHLSNGKCPLNHPPSGYLITGVFTRKWNLKKQNFYHLVRRLKKEDIPTDLLPIDDGYAYYWPEGFVEVIKKYRYIEGLSEDNTKEEEVTEKVQEEESAKIEFQSVKEGTKILLKYQDTEGNEFEQVLPLGTSLMLSIEKAKE